MVEAHQTRPAVEASAPDRLLVQCLDGSHDRAGLLQALATAVDDGTLELECEGLPVRSRDAALPLLAEALEPSLQRLADHALLLA